MSITPPVTHETLAAIGHRIHRSFRSLESDARVSKDDDSFFPALVNESQRFGLWAKNLGLYGLGHSSLDYRFRDAPAVYQYTYHLLVNLEKSVLAIQQDLSRQSTGREMRVLQPHSSPEKAFDEAAGLDQDYDKAYASDESSEDEEALMSYQEVPISIALLENAKLIVDRLYKLSFKIRNPATRLGFSKARNYSAIDEDTGVDLMRRYAYYDWRHVTEVMARYWQMSQVECENHVLVRRLARANTNRRRQFGQWRRHHMKMELVGKLFVPEVKHIYNTKTAPNLSKIPQRPKTGALSLPSTATNFDENNVDLNDTASAISTSTYAVIFAEDNKKGVNIPPLPETLRTGNEFECPLCHVLCSRHVASKTLWERHVFKDLRPYVCTYEDCAEGDQQYDSFNDWASHEVNVHCHEIARRASPSQQPSEERQSAVGLPKSSLQPQPSIAPNDISRQECPICLEKNPTFYHIGLHLRQFAVFALPNLVGTDENTKPGDQSSDFNDFGDSYFEDGDLDEEVSVSSQSFSTWVGKDSMHENDNDGESDKRNRSTSGTQADVNYFEHTLRQFDRVFDKPDIERYFAGLASENASTFHGEPSNAEPPVETRQASRAGDISFYVRIERLEPNYQAQTAQHGSHGYWSPPTIKEGFITRGRSLFYWRGGIMTEVGAHKLVSHPVGQIHSAATLFTQNPDTPHLLVVPFDVRQRDVIGYPGVWRPLSFRHVPTTKLDTYSAVVANGDCQHIAARGSAHWMPQLLPRVYDDENQSTRRQAGLIGSLPLLIALAAFSAPVSFLSSVLTNCVRPGRWQPHEYQYPSGHTPERGMVVTISFDPKNSQRSNINTLVGLENGRFGPFYS